jgi:MFS family permease
VIIGGWIKCLINYWFYWTIVGMFFVGVGLFLLLNCMVNISLDWFGPKERVLMTSWSNLISFSGIALGFFLPKIWIDNNEKDHEVSKDQIYNFLFYTAVMVTPGLLTWILYQNKPKT